jgi:hypothetical protein
MAGNELLEAEILLPGRNILVVFINHPEHDGCVKARCAAAEVQKERILTAQN